MQSGNHGRGWATKQGMEAEQTETRTGDIRAARLDDAHDLVELIAMAGSGIPLSVWQHHAPPGMPARAFGLDRVRRRTGTFSYRNADVLEAGGRVAGLLLSYPLPDALVPAAEGPPFTLPLEQLEAEAAGGYYVNALAVYPGVRGRGHGRSLMEHAFDHAREAGRDRVCLIAFANNDPAMALYDRLGFRPVGRRPAIDEPALRELGEPLLLSAPAGVA